MQLFVHNADININITVNSWAIFKICRFLSRQNAATREKSVARATLFWHNLPRQIAAIKNTALCGAMFALGLSLLLCYSLYPPQAERAIFIFVYILC